MIPIGEDGNGELPCLKTPNDDRDCLGNEFALNFFVENSLAQEHFSTKTSKIKQADFIFR